MWGQNQSINLISEITQYTVTGQSVERLPEKHNAHELATWTKNMLINNTDTENWVNGGAGGANNKNAKSKSNPFNYGESQQKYMLF